MTEFSNLWRDKETCGLRDVTGFMLSTRTTHGLYEPFGFVTPSDPTRYMVRRRPEPK